MKFLELISTESQTEQMPRLPFLPTSVDKIDNREIKIIITLEFYDAALSGTLQYKNKIYYFQICDGTSWYGYGDEIPDFKEDFWRRYIVINATKVEEYIATQEQTDETKLKFHKSLLNCEVIGWFEVDSALALNAME